MIDLLKPFLSLFIALSAVLGHGVANGELDSRSLGLGALVWFLAMGAGLLNNYQDRYYDRHFDRTRNRPLARAEISPSWVAAMALGIICLALGLLFAFFGPTGPWIPGLLGIICYNGLYTPMKKKGLGALIPGVICGMLPPAMGWAAAGYSLPYSGPILVMWVMGLWQVAHFLILQARCPVKDALRAYPVLVRTFPGSALFHQIFLWTSLYSLSLFLFLLHQGGLGWGAGLAVALNGLCLPLAVGGLLWRGRLFRIPASTLCHGLLIVSIFIFMAAGLWDGISA
ncbi:MAG: UbiA family prenyltransferase [Desulfobacterales bacterium]|nr:UbiA family prenyltransferase [Desulfobacterales bacterium]